MTESQIRELCKRWQKLNRDMDNARDQGLVRTAESYENSIARIEETLRRNYVPDPNVWLD